MVSLGVSTRCSMTFAALPHAGIPHPGDAVADRAARDAELLADLVDGRSVLSPVSIRYRFPFILMKFENQASYN